MAQRLGAFCCSVFVVAVCCVAVAPAAEAGWLPPVDLSEPAGHTGVPQVVLDSEGNATAVWDRWNGTETVVESAYRPAGEGWEAPVDISAEELEGETVVPGGSAQSPRLGVDGSGDVTVVFERWSEDGIQIQAADRPAGGSWSVPVALDEPTFGSNPEPWVAVDAAGDAIAVWKHGEVIHSSFRPVGAGWEAPVAVSGEECFVPQAAMNAAGDATVVWMHDDGGRLVVESAFRPAAGGWESPTLVSRAGEEGGDPQIALDGAGDTLVAWRGEDEGTEYVRTAYRPVGGSWSAPTDASVAGEHVQAQSIKDAVDPDGNAIVAWSGDGTEAGGYDIVRAAFRPAGGGWEAPTDLSASGGNGFPSDVVFDQGGNAAIVWQRGEGSDDIVEASYRPAEGGWESATRLSEAGMESYDPVVVLDAPGDTTAADGDATAAWVADGPSSCEGPKGAEACSGTRVQAAGYDPEGLPEVELELPASAEAGEPVAISVASELYSPRIDFGDGESTAGTATSHTYDQPGEYVVSGSGAEVLGYKTSALRTITILPAGAATSPADGGPAGQGGPPAGQTPAGTSPGGQSLPAQPPSAVSEVMVSSAACVAARATLKAERRYLKRAGAKHRGRAALKKALRRVAAAC
jgi:hypothetical protein